MKRILSPWKRILIGSMTKGSLVDQLEQRRMLRNFRKEVTEYNYARPMMQSDWFAVSTKMVWTEFVVLELGYDLGFKDPPKTADFMTDGFCSGWSVNSLRDQEIGMCHPEDGPQLRLQYLGQPEELVFVGMPPLPVKGAPHVFYLGNFEIPDVADKPPETSLLIDGAWAPPDRRWSLATKVAYRLYR